MFQLLVERNVDSDIDEWFVNYSNLKHTEHSGSRGVFCWIVSYYQSYAEIDGTYMGWSTFVIINEIITE